MSVTQIIFYIFSALTIYAATMVVFSKNPVRAVLFLVLTFVATSGLWILIQAEFLAIILVLVYVGAVMVLFLFVVMMLDINYAPLREGFTRYIAIGLVIGALIVAQIVWVVKDGFATLTQLQLLPADYSNTKALGHILYTQYVVAFELAAVLLLVAMIAAVGLTLRGTYKRRSQNINQQVQVKKEDRLRMVKDMSADPEIRET